MTSFDIRKHLCSEITIALALIFFIASFGVRVVQFVEIDWKWNKGHVRIQQALASANKIKITNEFAPGTVILEIQSKEKIQRMLELIVFKPVAPVSFWRVPMLPKNFRKHGSACMDHLKVWFYDGDRVIGYFWISGQCRELTFFMISEEGGMNANDNSEHGIMFEESYRNVAIWFLQEGISHYVRFVD